MDTTNATTTDQAPDVDIQEGDIVKVKLTYRTNYRQAYVKGVRVHGGRVLVSYAYTRQDSRHGLVLQSQDHVAILGGKYPDSVVLVERDHDWSAK
jgi:hypothetical protein